MANDTSSAMQDYLNALDELAFGKDPAGTTGTTEDEPAPNADSARTSQSGSPLEGNSPSESKKRRHLGSSEDVVQKRSTLTAEDDLPSHTAKKRSGHLPSAPQRAKDGTPPTVQSPQSSSLAAGRSQDQVRHVSPSTSPSPAPATREAVPASAAIPATVTTKMTAVKSSQDADPDRPVGTPAPSASTAEQEEPKPKQRPSSRYVYSAKQIRDDAVAVPVRNLDVKITDPGKDPDSAKLNDVSGFYNRNSGQDGKGQLFQDQDETLFGAMDQGTDVTYDEALRIRQIFEEVKDTKSPMMHTIFDEIEEASVPAAQKPQGFAMSDDLPEDLGEDGDMSLDDEPEAPRDEIRVNIYPAAQYSSDQFPSVKDFPSIRPEGFKVPDPKGIEDQAPDYSVDDVVAAMVKTGQISTVPADGACFEDAEVFEEAVPGEEEVHFEDRKPPSTAAQPVTMKIAEHMPLMVSRFSSDSEGTVGRAVITSLDPTVVGYNILKLLRNTLIGVLGIEIEGTVDGDECVFNYTRKDELLTATVEKKHDVGLLTEAAGERGEPANLRVTRLNKSSKKVIKEEMPVMPYETVGDLMPHGLKANFARVIFTSDGNDYMVVLSKTSPNIGVSWDRVGNDEPVKGLPDFMVEFSGELATAAVRDFSRSGLVIAKKAAPATELSYKYEAFEVTKRGEAKHVYPQQAREMARDGKA